MNSNTLGPGNDLPNAQLLAGELSSVPEARFGGTSRDTLLDAAEEVVNSKGVGRLTLAAVAKQAGLSKSGLLHHFPSKDALVEALVLRTVELWNASLQQAIELQPVGPQRAARGLLECCLGDMSAWNERLRRSSTALLAVLVHCPQKGTPMHAFYQQLHATMLTESPNLPCGDLVLAVVDGIWLRWVTGLAPLEESQIMLLHETLKQFLDQVCESKPVDRQN